MSFARIIVASLAMAISTVAATHVLAYHLIRLLPEAAVRMAELMGGYEPALASLRARFPPRGYLEIVSSTLRGDLGITVDGERVIDAIGAQVAETAPRLILAGLLVVIAAWAFIWFVRPRAPRSWLLNYLCLIPPYVYALGGQMLVLSFALPLDNSPGGGVWWLTVGLSAVAPAALIGSQSLSLVFDANASSHAEFARSMGVSRAGVRALLSREVLVALTPSIERAFVWTFVSLLFAEIVFGVPGFGSGFAAALRRSDTNMLLAQITTLAIFSNSVRVVADLGRASVGAPA